MIPETTPDYSRKWYILLAVGMGIFLATIDGSIVNIALPTLVTDLHTDFAIVQWVVLAYLLAIISLLPAVGRLSDIYGKKGIYAAGFIVFTVGSVLCGLSASIEALIAFRVLQAIGAAMVVALGMAIVTEAFPENERGKAIGVTGTIVSIGIAIGPTLGGLILQNLTWHWVFFVNLPVGIIGTFTVFCYVPFTKSGARQRFDFLGAVILSAVLLTFMLSLTWGQFNGFGSPGVFLLAGGSVLLVAVFIRIEAQVKQPVIDINLFKYRYFSSAILTGMIVFICITGSTLLIPFYAENIMGYDPQKTGLLMATIPIALGVISPLSGILSDRYGSDAISVVGLGISALGFLAVSGLTTETSVTGFILRFLPIGLGVGLFQSANYSAIMGSGSRKHLGVISGIVSVMRSLGQASGIAVIGALWAGRVFFHSGGVLKGGATLAAVGAQLLGLQDVFVYVTILCFATMLLSLWGATGKHVPATTG
jgi:EmrB/QacA subfamily drug resistance transporter